MNSKMACTLCFFICLSLVNAHAQDTTARKLNLKGYLSNMQTIMDMDILDGSWLYQSQFHNRFNAEFDPFAFMTLTLHLRNRFIFGDLFKMDYDRSYVNMFKKDAGWMDLSFNLATGKSYILHSIIDRFSVRFNMNRFLITVGRQRINWGQNYVWNPNDWFNSYSFFDFDYEERPGSDAIRIQYFTGYTSSAEVAVKADSGRKVTAAALFRINRWQYDFQVLGGLLAGEDVGAGFGWSGNLFRLGFRGEISYFRSIENFKDTTGLFYFSAGLDYVFTNSLMIQVEAYFNQLPEGFEKRNIVEYYQRPLTVKDLSFTELNLFCQLSYPVTPLLTGSFAAMYFPEDKGYYIGPGMTYSLAENVDFSIYVQAFSGEFQPADNGNNRQYYNLGFIRFRYSF